MKILYRWMGDTLQVDGGYFTGGWGNYKAGIRAICFKKVLRRGAGAVLKTSAAPGRKTEGR